MSHNATKPEYIEGLVFDRLTVTKLLPVVTGTKRTCLCDCSCGTKGFRAIVNALKSGNVRSCGCIQKEKRINIKSGDIFERLTVIKQIAKDKNGALRYLCKCECGNKLKVKGTALKHKNTGSCGCLRKDLMTTHDQTESRTYSSWKAMKARCYNEKQESYEDYGGKGVIVCAKWKDSFEHFYADMGDRPKGKTLDRIDPFGNYEPDNCRWTTPIKQGNNKRYNVEIQYNGKTMTLAMACRKHFGIKKLPLDVYNRAYQRLLRGFSHKKLFD